MKMNQCAYCKVDWCREETEQTRHWDRTNQLKPFGFVRTVHVHKPDYPIHLTMLTRRLACTMNRQKCSLKANSMVAINWRMEPGFVQFRNRNRKCQNFVGILRNRNRNWSSYKVFLTLRRVATGPCDARREFLPIPNVELKKKTRYTSENFLKQIVTFPQNLKIL
jgi:hypothetical protein